MIVRGLAGLSVVLAWAGVLAAAPDRAWADPVIEPPRLAAPLELTYPAPGEGGALARVTLEVVVTAEGKVSEARVVDRHPAGLEAAALDAVRRAQFQPATRDGIPVAARIRHEIRFAAPPAPSAPTAVATSPPPGPTTGDAQPAGLEVVVHGPSSAGRLRRGAHAVEVVELGDSARRAADLGEVLARSSSLRVQREGGLGSQGRYGLAGLSGDRVRFFIEGVPLELSAYQLGIANVPVNLLDRAEVYHGVVPARFGADALAGAVNLVADDRVHARLWSASYQLGSFDTHRLALGTRQASPPRGLFLRAAGFLDVSANDYPIDVQVEDQQGRLSPAKLPRFHDGFRGVGGTITAGLLDRPWASRLALELFGARYDRQVQHNPLATVPYGEVSYRRLAAGGNLRYRLRAGRTQLDAVAGYALRRGGLRDLSTCRYDWYGRCFLRNPLPGELDPVAKDRRIDEHTGFARAELAFAIAAGHTLRLAAAPTLLRRRGRDAAVPDPAQDPLREERTATTNVVGLEYELAAGPLAVILVGKGYQQVATDQLRLPSGALLDLDHDNLLFGGGLSTRLILAPQLYLKASYEWATRLPSGDERFGDGGTIDANLRLQPERSHNLALGLVLDDRATPLGLWRGRLSGTGRRVNDLVALVGNGSTWQYDNVSAARVLALDAGLGWSEPRDRLGLDGSLAIEDARNTSTTGPGAAFRGDRIPNRPFLQAAAGAYLRAHALLAPRDFLELHWAMRHVRAFEPGWQSAGSEAAAAARLRVPPQTQQTLGLGYVFPERGTTLGASFEVHNLTDARAFDVYGVQRPGRSFSLKLTATHE